MLPPGLHSILITAVLDLSKELHYVPGGWVNVCVLVIRNCNYRTIPTVHISVRVSRNLIMILFIQANDLDHQQPTRACAAAKPRVCLPSNSRLD